MDGQASDEDKVKLWLRREDGSCVNDDGARKWFMEINLLTLALDLLLPSSLPTHAHRCTLALILTHSLSHSHSHALTFMYS